MQWVSAATFVAVLLARTAFADDGAGIEPPNGFVPDEATAVGIAEAVLMPIAGEVGVEVQRPFVAFLQGDICRVNGTFGNIRDKYMFTTPFVVEISKSDGRVLLVTTQ